MTKQKLINELSQMDLAIIRHGDNQEFLTFDGIFDEPLYTDRIDLAYRLDTNNLVPILSVLSKIEEKTNAWFEIVELINSKTSYRVLDNIHEIFEIMNSDEVKESVGKEIKTTLESINNGNIGFQIGFVIPGKGLNFLSEIPDRHMTKINSVEELEKFLTPNRVSAQTFTSESFKALAYTGESEEIKEIHKNMLEITKSVTFMFEDGVDIATNMLFHHLVRDELIKYAQKEYIILD